MLRVFGNTIRQRPRTTLLVLGLLLLMGSGVGIYLHALHRWSAAQIALKDNRPEDAHRHLAFCLTVWPRSIPVHLLAARAARVRGELGTAETHLNRCLQLAHGATDAIQIEFLLLRVQRGELDEVAPMLINLVSANHPETPLILETLAGAYMHNLHYRKALRCLQGWIEAEPDSAQAHKWRGWIYDRMNYISEATKDYSRALELNPDLVAVRLRLAEIYLEKFEAPKAAPHLKLLHDQFPDRADVLAKLGHCRMLQGKTDEARPLLEAALEKLPDDPVVLIHLAQLDIRLGKLARAEGLLRRALKGDPTDSVARFNLYTCLQRQGREQEAAATLADLQKYKALLERANKLLREEAEQPTKDASRPAEAGAMLVQIGQDRLGLHWLHEALKREPAHQATHKVLADYYTKKGQKDKADAHRGMLPPVVSKNEPANP